MKRVNLDPIVECQDWELKEHQIKYSENGGKITLSKLNNGIIEPITKGNLEYAISTEFTISTLPLGEQKAEELVPYFAIKLDTNVGYVLAKTNKGEATTRGTALKDALPLGTSLLSNTPSLFRIGSSTKATEAIEGQTIQILDASSIKEVLELVSILNLLDETN